MTRTQPISRGRRPGVLWPPTTVFTICGMCGGLQRLASIGGLIIGSGSSRTLHPGEEARCQQVPIAGMGSLLLVELFSNPRARAAVRRLARRPGRRLAPGTVPGRPVAAHRSAIACQVTVVEEPAAVSVLVRCVETALAVPRPDEPPTAAAR
jgi:hypothetical protein